MRLFVALDLPDPVLGTLDVLLSKLKPTAALQWSAVGNLHITTKFIGEWPEGRLAELKAALAAIPRRTPLAVRVEGLGWFPNPHAPRVFWAGVRGALAELARDTDEACARLGVAAETRDFHPHLTLARARQAANLAALRQAVAALDSVEFGEFEVRSQFLYLSKDSVYTKLEEFPL